MTGKEKAKVYEDNAEDKKSRKSRKKSSSTKSGSNSGGSKKSGKSKKSRSKKPPLSPQASILKKPTMGNNGGGVLNVQPLDNNGQAAPDKEPKTILKHGGGNKYIPDKSVLVNKEEFMRKCMKQFMICGKIYRKKNLARIAAKEVTKLKKQMKKKDTIAGLISLAIMIIYFYEYETFLAEVKVNGIATKKRHESTNLNSILRGLMLMMSIVVCFFVVMHYKLKLKLEKKMKLRHD